MKILNDRIRGLLTEITVEDFTRNPPEEANTEIAET
jgi:hypothetical protein